MSSDVFTVICKFVGLSNNKSYFNFWGESWHDSVAEKLKYFGFRVNIVQ